MMVAEQALRTVQMVWLAASAVASSIEKLIEALSQGFSRIESMTQEDVHFIDKSAESEVGALGGSTVSVPTLA